jgi:hypothetical protein
VDRITGLNLLDQTDRDLGSMEDLTMGETLDYINSMGGESACESGIDFLLDYECSACGMVYQTEGRTRNHIVLMRKKKGEKSRHKRAFIMENHETDGPGYYHRIRVR